MRTAGSGQGSGLQFLGSELLGQGSGLQFLGSELLGQGSGKR